MLEEKLLVCLFLNGPKTAKELAPLFVGVHLCVLLAHSYRQQFISQIGERSSPVWSIAEAGEKLLFHGL